MRCAAVPATTDHAERPWYFTRRRTRILSKMIARRLPQNGRVLDLGCGDGSITKAVQIRRPDITIQGIDILVRPQTHIPVIPFDGTRIPFEDKTFDAVTIIDALHHSSSPQVLLNEAARVSRDLILIKDHTLKGVLARLRLLYLDWVGNAPHGVSIPANYWPEQKWHDTFLRMGLNLTDWTGQVRIFPWWISWLFDGSLNFLASLSISGNLEQAD